MSPHPTPIPNDPNQQAEDAQFYRHVLHDFINIGTGLARLLPQQAAAHPQPQPEPDHPAPPPSPEAVITATIAFDRLARAVRRCIALARIVAQPPAPAKHPARHRTAARKQIIRKIEDLIQRPSSTTGEALDPECAEALHAELLDRMDAPDLDDDVTSRPVADIIREITRDLGLDRLPGTRPFRRRTPADIAQLCARASAPSRPRQPGPQPATAPQAPGPDAAHPAPNPQPAAKPAAAPHAQPGGTGPIHPGNLLPDDPAEAVAFVLRHGAQARWRPPPGA